MRLPNLKKLLLLSSMMIGITGAMTACSNSNSTEGTPEHPYTIIWYMIGTSQPDQDMVIEKLNAYLIPKIGAK